MCNACFGRCLLLGLESLFGWPVMQFALQDGNVELFHLSLVTWWVLTSFLQPHIATQRLFFEKTKLQFFWKKKIVEYPKEGGQGKATWICLDLRFVRILKYVVLEIPDASWFWNINTMLLFIDEPNVAHAGAPPFRACVCIWILVSVSSQWQSNAKPAAYSLETKRYKQQLNIGAGMPQNH